MLFITANHTGAGKTLVSAIVAEALGAHYWKPVQAGLPADSQFVQAHLSRPEKVLPERYRLQEPASPHHAAELEGLHIRVADFSPPQVEGPLVVEGAGGLLVPLNRTETMADLAAHLGADVVLVVRHYLGSINHTLLSCEAIRARKLPVAGIVFNGAPYPSAEEIILQKCGFPVLGRLNEEESVSFETVTQYARLWKPTLLKYLR